MTRLFLGNLDYKTDETKLIWFFGKCGVESKQCNVARDAELQSRRFAFMIVEDSDRSKALAISGRYVGGRSIVVKIAGQKSAGSRTNPRKVTRTRQAAEQGSLFA